ncbi:MAG: LPS-assembly protein LptD [Legionellaceae bacterium]|nr:LPS-assembly protein LptD [Legionellaceae bacterium]
MKIRFSERKAQGTALIGLLAMAAVVFALQSRAPSPKREQSEPVQACVFSSPDRMSPLAQATCLGWRPYGGVEYCAGSYTELQLPAMSDAQQVRIQADEVSFSQQERSYLKGNVQVQQSQRIVSAQTAYVYRDAKSNKINRIELLEQVRYVEPGRLMWATYASINPNDKAGEVRDVLYRFDSDRAAAILPAWGRASSVRRYANEDYLMKEVSYSTCNPQRPAWRLLAKSLKLDAAQKKGVARDAKFQIADRTVLYTPYLSFPTTDERKSGFLLPVKGYSKLGGYDLALPYYWNMAPNYDATLMPHYYSKRGMMLGGEFRYLFPHTQGRLETHFLPSDRAFGKFITDNQAQYPQLSNEKENRWAIMMHNQSQLLRNLRLNISYNQVSDPYYLQDFVPNLSTATERQLDQRANLVFNTDNWRFSGMLQRYQTLNPINQRRVASVYEQLPQLQAQGKYHGLPGNSQLRFMGQYNYFHWPDNQIERVQGGRAAINPGWAMPQYFPWGYIKPEADVVYRDYQLEALSTSPATHYSNAIPRMALDSGLYFDRYFSWQQKSFSQTLEPRLFYLYVPYTEQSDLPVFDSGYLIFNYDQLFRFNRFSGLDRIGDTNQLSYALSSRILSSETGYEKLMMAVGQSHYFSDRRVQLCRNRLGRAPCQDNPNRLGYLSLDSPSSPVVFRAVYHWFRPLSLSGDYVWDPATRATNNGHLNLRYQPGPTRVFNLGYNYLINGDASPGLGGFNNDKSLHQAYVSYAWPFNDHWSTLGGVNYNISKHYSMMRLLGVQYDSCCWAMRLMAGQTFISLNEQLRPRYNNNIYVQFLLKGLGSVANGDPSGVIRTFVPGYQDMFHR